MVRLKFRETLFVSQNLNHVVLAVDSQDEILRKCPQSCKCILYNSSFMLRTESYENDFNKLFWFETENLVYTLTGQEKQDLLQ